MTPLLPRRAALAAGAALLAAPSLARAQAAEPIRIGSLTPNTGAGAQFGPEIAEAHRKVVDLVNGQEGGVLGRQIRLTQENDESNPEAAVRAARKLIDADRVSAILGTWASSVTLGVLPLVEAANVLLFCTSSSDDIPAANRRGLVFNFQPLNAAWAVALARLATRRGFREVAVAGPNNDFATTLVSSFRRSLAEAGGRLANEPFFYNAGQPSYRAEVERLLRGNPPAVFIPGYVADFTAVYRDIYRAGYRGQVLTLSFAVGPQFKQAVGAAADGILHGFPVPPVGSPTYDAYLRFVGKTPNGEVQNPYGCAGYDQINLLLLAIAAAGTTDVDAVKAQIPRIANGPGERVTTFVEGLAAIRAGRPVNYDGASSSVEFKPDGSLLSRDFELYEIRGGRDVPVERITSAS
jgi:branched-chain amino acid transport system substrate-binding protein